LFNDGHNWQSLGVVQLTSGTQITVTLNGFVGKRVVADAIRVIKKAPTYEYDYDKASNVQTITDPLGRVTDYDYDNFHRLLRGISPDPDGGGSALHRPAIEYGYNKVHDVLTVEYGPWDTTDFVTGESRTTSYLYDGLSQLVKKTLQDPDGNPATTGDTPIFEYAYDLAGNLTKFTDSRGAVTEYDYDNWHRLMTITRPDADGESPFDYPVTNYEYDDASQVTSIRDPDPDAGGSLGQPEYVYEYDGAGRMVNETLPDPDGPSGSGGTEYEVPVYTYDYDRVGNTIRTTDPRGGFTTWQYDALHRLIKRIDPDPDGEVGGFLGINYFAPETEWTYDVAGQVLTTTGPNPDETESNDGVYVRPVTTFDYDRLGRLLTETLQDPSPGSGDDTPVYGYRYDSVGNLVKTIDALGHETDYTFDSLNRITKRLDPDPLGTPPTESERPETLYAYDEYGNLKTLTDPANNTTHWFYDKLERPTTERIVISSTNKDRTFKYDPMGNRVQAIDRNGRKIEWDYDFLGRMVEENWFSSAADNSSDHRLAYGFNQSGWLTSADSNAGGDADSHWESQYDYEYDHLGRAKTVDSVFDWAIGGTSDIAAELEFKFDDNSNRTELLVDFGTSGNSAVTDFKNVYDYDTLDRLVQLEQLDQSGGNTVAEKKIEFLILNNDQYLLVMRNSWASSSWQMAAKTLYGYDQLGRLADLWHRKPNDNNIEHYDEIEYDKSSQLTQLRTKHTTNDPQLSTYTYDRTNQLTGVDNEPDDSLDRSYAFDENGNRTEVDGTEYSADSDGYNRVLQDGTYQYEWDDEGNLTKRIELVDDDPDGETIEFTWDHRNRLTKLATYSDATLTTKTKEVLYTYDAFDRRIKKSIDTTSQFDHADAAVEQYVYDGEDIILRFDGSNALKSRYLHGPLVDQILADEQYGGDASHDQPASEPGNVYWPLGDHQGSIRDIVDNSGAVVRHTVYDAFGVIQSGETGTISTLYGFTGRERDDESHLDYYRARYYDAAIGRFVSVDPISFDAGDENLYRYVGNSPPNFTDSTGTFNDGYTGGSISGKSSAAAEAKAAADSAVAQAEAAARAKPSPRPRAPGIGPVFEGPMGPLDIVAEFFKEFGKRLVDGRGDDAIRGFADSFTDHLDGPLGKGIDGGPKEGHKKEYEEGREIGDAAGKTADVAMILHGLAGIGRALLARGTPTVVYQLFLSCDGTLVVSTVASRTGAGVANAIGIGIAEIAAGIINALSSSSHGWPPEPTPEQQEATRLKRELEEQKDILKEGRGLQNDAVQRGDFGEADKLGELNERHEAHIKRLQREFDQYLKSIGL
jgi:RHS repeat-associated protein